MSKGADGQKGNPSSLLCHSIHTEEKNCLKFG